MKNKLVLLMLFLLLITPFSAFAQEDSQLKLKEQTFNPGFIYYPLKRGFEKIWENLMFSDNAKKDFYYDLALTRLSELKYIVENKELGEVQTSTQRFSATIGTLTKILEKNNDKEENRKAISEFEKYSQVLKELQKNYTFNTSYWMLLEHSINSLKEYSLKLQV